MLFSSTFFLIYFLPVFFSIYYLLPAKLKNYFIVLASVLFYAWGAPGFVLILSTAVVVDFYIARLIHEHEGKSRKYFLAAGIIFNVSVLLYFKYFNFFVDNLNLLFHFVGKKEINFTRVALPIGISFFVFHEMSYLIDLYRRVKPPMKNIIDYALYIFLFPQLIAGPIIRFNEIADQIKGRKFLDNADDCLLGLFRFSIGLAKKVLIANVLGAEADKIFHLQYNELTASSAWIGAICYTFQIYFDFSGYSDMAIGLGKMMGFSFPENFNHPYISQNITEFWRRWHMSLSRWMRDYLYISLGGNKVSVPMMYFNLCLVFLISGFWHGAQWTFIIWGAYHGLFLVLDRLFLLRITERIGRIPKILFTFFILVIGWIPFRSENMSQAFMFLRKMFSFSYREYFLSTHTVVVLVISILLSLIPLAHEKISIKNFYAPSALSVRRASVSVLVILIFMTLCIGEIASTGFNPFIYFRF